MGLNEVQKKTRSDYLENNLIITECSQKKQYAFVSYASDDWETVFKQAVIPLQQQYGLHVYADKAFDKLNDKWIVPMLRNVRGSDLMLVFVSQNYIESYACFLELLTAVNNKKQIVFVDLGGGLHLGDTTDQPNIERGVKNEILNQGANISTNTNNSSNDLMRAMKSSFTSISTLLEQDALSKYDISDAFINFFRDASINRKSINDLRALMHTIKSVSNRVFDKIPEIPAKAPAPQEQQAVGQPAQSVQPEARTGEQPAPSDPSKAGPAAQSFVRSQGEEITAQSAGKPQPEVQAAAEYRLDELVRKGPAGSRPRGKKSIAILIGAAAGLAVVIMAFVLISSRSKQVEAMAYEFSMQDGNKMQLYSGEYTGEWKSNKPYRQGSFSYEDADNSDNNFVYEGEWEDGLANGQGTMTWADDAVYEGEFAGGKRNGQGTYTWADGSVYEGEWVNGWRNGQGTYTMTNGYCYKGEWKDGKASGQGTMTFAEDDDKGRREYVGEFANDKRNGQGTMTWTSGAVYEGGWKDGNRSGQGTHTFAKDDKYNRRDYTGQWENDKASGQGTMTWTNGAVYEGGWKDGIRSGQGTYTFAEDDESGCREYAGEFANDKRDGQGTMTWTNGAVYEGEWKDGIRSGQGTYTFAKDDKYNRRDYTGQWENDKPNGQGTMTWTNGNVYEGEWKDGSRDGYGKHTAADGTVHEGTWKEDKFVG